MAPIPSGTVGDSNDKVNFIGPAIKGRNAERDKLGAYRPRKFSRKGQIRNSECMICVWSSFRCSLSDARPPACFAPVLADLLRWFSLPFSAWTPGRSELWPSRWTPPPQTHFPRSAGAHLSWPHPQPPYATTYLKPLSFLRKRYSGACLFCCYEYVLLQEITLNYVIIFSERLMLILMRWKSFLLNFYWVFLCNW